MLRLHVHRCRCGAAWLCGKADCRIENVCTACEDEQRAAWFAAHEYLAQARLDMEAPNEAQEITR